MSKHPIWLGRHPFILSGRSDSWRNLLPSRSLTGDQERGVDAELHSLNEADRPVTPAGKDEPVEKYTLHTYHHLKWS